MVAQRSARGYRRTVPIASFPAALLADDEDLVLDTRPHPIALVMPVLETMLIVAAVVIVALVIPFHWGLLAYLLIMLGGVAMFLIWPARPLVKWLTSHFVVTTERVMRRTGLVARHSVEISLEKITDVRVSQTIIERMVNAGDLTLESAGRTGREVFEDVRAPDAVQKMIFEMKERGETRRQTVAAQLPNAGWGPTSVADELTKLHQLLQQGVLTEEEFQTAKARLLHRV